MDLNSIGLNIIALIFGFSGLIYCANQFVDGAVGLSQKLGVSELMIGLTVVAMGTSAPEIFVSATAAINQATFLAVGNGVGSNIANIGLVMGSAMIFVRIQLQRHMLFFQIPFLLFVTIFFGALILDNRFSRLDGIGLLLLLLGYLCLCWHLSQKEKFSVEKVEPKKNSNPWALLIIGLLGLMLFSKLLVFSAQNVAKWLGVSEVIIGLSVIALGTSLPEFVSVIMSSIKGYKDIAVGAIIGSNVFNILAVIGLAVAIEPLDIEGDFFKHDYLSMLIFTVIFCATWLFTLKKDRKIVFPRYLGLLLVVCYIAYCLSLFGIFG